MGLSLSPFNIGNVVNDPSSAAPDATAQFLRALLQGQEAGVRGFEEAGRNSRSSAQLDIEKQQLAFQIAREKTEQNRIKATGEAMKILLPHLIATGQAPSGQGGSGVGGQNTPVPQPGGLPSVGLTGGQEAMPTAPADIYAQFIQNADPSIVKSVNDVMGATVASAQKAYDAKRLGKATQSVVGRNDKGAALAELPPELVLDVLDQVGKLATVETQERRKAIAAKYPAVANETTEQMIARLGKMSGEFATSGDHSMVAALASDIGALTPSKTDYEWFLTKDGKTVYLPKEEGSRLRLGKPISTTGFGFGAAGPLGAMRAMSGIAGMADADEKMRRYEIKVASGQADLTDKDYFQGQISSLYNKQNEAAGLAGHIVPFFGTAAGTQMLERLNKSNPEYAQYLQAAAQWALEESLLSNRPSDFRTKMDEFISAVKPGAKPPIIHDLWKSRSVRLKGYQEGLPAIRAAFERMASMGSGPGVTTIPEQP